VFMVADRVEVTSRRAGSDEAWVWRSEGGAGYELAPASEEQAKRVPRGTEVLIHLKEDTKKYAERFEVERIVRTYSDHILFPIELVDDKGEAKQINAASAPWQRSKSELKPEDYTEAYKSLAGAFDEPALTLHYRAEGRQSYAVLLFVPSMRPFDLADPGRKGRIKLYVRRVYITDDADLLPPYLRFVRGVIDSEDLPLNVSREMLQNNPQVGQIRTAVTGRVLGEREGTAEQVSEVRASQRLTDSAACLVASTGARDRELERLLARQERGSGAKPVLELNMRHDIVKALARSIEEKKETDVADLSALLLAQAQI